MKFSENWLREWVDIPGDSAALAERLTLSGLEVADVERIGAALAGVIVARIAACEPHPDADRLRVCRVDTGDGQLQIVCGAPNARAGLVAPLALVGARLPNGTTIRATKLRGVESRGMLCSAAELAIDADASGLMELPADAVLGQPLADCLGQPDTALEIELTPNRGDCLGMLGLAFEVAAEFSSRAKPFAAIPVAPTIAAPRGIRLDAGVDCPRYLGRAVRDIDIAKPPPLWLRQRLRAGGIKPINVVVDVMNYVMLETGQPLHAFDEAKLDGDIVVRRANKDEPLKLLEGTEATLDPGFVVIADQAKALAVAGVIGGFDSRVTDATCNVFLEAAHFAPAAIVGRARRLGLVTDAAHRFERGVDPELPRTAIERATALLRDAAGGEPGEMIEAALAEHLPRRAPINLRSARVTRVLGVAVESAEVERILVGLGMHVVTVAGGWRVVPPTRRFDVHCEEDLIEEVARIHGYGAIPARLPGGVPPLPRTDETTLDTRVLDAQLVARGYREAVCYAFVDAGLLRAWQLDAGAVALGNPLSAEMAVMRTSLLPGLVDALRRNRNRQQTRVRLFESGVVFQSWGRGLGTGDWGPGTRDQGKAKTKAKGEADVRENELRERRVGWESSEAKSKAAADDDAPQETTMLAAVACGSARAEQWGEPRRALDFFSMKGDLESLIALSAAPGRWSFDDRNLPPWLHPGRGARVLRDRACVGFVGLLHPALQQALDLPEVCAFEVKRDALCGRAVAVAEELPRFPSLRRDIAIEVDEAVAWAGIATAIRSRWRTIVKELALFDCFRGPGVTEGRKSLAMGLILQDVSRTLTDQDADRCVADAVAMLEREFGAHLRE